MIETLLDYLFNTSEYRKEHNLGFIVKDEDGKELCNSKETKTLEDWMRCSNRKLLKKTKRKRP